MFGKRPLSAIFWIVVGRMRLRIMCRWWKACSRAMLRGVSGWGQGCAAFHSGGAPVGGRERGCCRCKVRGCGSCA